MPIQGACGKKYLIFCNMAIDSDFDLFISGSPNGNQQWPDSSEELFSQQFFAMDTDTQNSCDYIIEIRSKNDGHRYSYYSYVKRKELSGTVNGGKGIRQGAYFAMSIRFKDVYCKGLRNLYALMDIAYKNYILDNVIKETPKGSAYLIEAFESKKSFFKNLENYFANQLGSIVSDLLPIGNTFPSSQSGVVSTMNLYEKSEASILDVFRKNGKIHLTVDCSDNEAALGTLKAQKDKQAGDFKLLSEKYNQLVKDKGEVDAELKQASKKISSYQDSIGRYETEVKNLECKQTVINNYLPYFEHFISEYSEVQNDSSGESGSWENDARYNRRDSNTGNNVRKHNNQNDIFSYLPWICCAICIIVLIFILLSPSNDNTVELQRQISALNEQVTEKEMRNRALSEQCEQYKKTIDNINKSLETIDEAPKYSGNPWDYINIPEITSGSKVVKGDFTVVLRSAARYWDIVEGKDNVEKRGNKAIFIKEGNVTIIAYDKDHNPIQASQRTIEIQPK